MERWKAAMERAHKKGGKMRTIKEGDIVNVFWNNEEELRDVKVMHTPSDMGDFWYFEDTKGTQWAINPMCSTFDTIIKRPPEALKEGEDG